MDFFFLHLQFITPQVDLYYMSTILKQTLFFFFFLKAFRHVGGLNTEYVQKSSSSLPKALTLYLYEEQELNCWLGEKRGIE